MPTKNNPAGCLLVILQRATKIEDGLETLHAWEQLLAPTPNLGILYHRLALVVQAPGMIERRIKRISSIGHKVHLKWIKPFRDALTYGLQLNSPWRNFRSRLDASILYGLEVCDESLSRHDPETSVDANDLRSLREQVLSVSDEIVKCEMDEKLKLYMLKHLDMVQRAIDDYLVAGSDGIITAFHATVGSFALNPALCEKMKDTPAGEKFWGVMRKVALLVTIAVSTITIDQHTFKLLPDPSDEPVTHSINSDAPASVAKETGDVES